VEPDGGRESEEREERDACDWRRESAPEPAPPGDGGAGREEVREEEEERRGSSGRGREWREGSAVGLVVGVVEAAVSSVSSLRRAN
jgi:hypothetical protein